MVVVVRALQISRPQEMVLLVESIKWTLSSGSVCLNNFPLFVSRRRVNCGMRRVVHGGGRCLNKRI